MLILNSDRKFFQNYRTKFNLDTPLKNYSSLVSWLIFILCCTLFASLFLSYLHTEKQSVHKAENKDTGSNYVRFSE